MRYSQATSVEVTPFTLSLPPELAAITPRWTIDLPAKHKALVYDTIIRRDDYVKGERTYVDVPGYRVRVLNGKGNDTSRRVSIGYHNNFVELLDLRIALEGAALELTSKVKTSRREHYVDEDDLD